MNSKNNFFLIFSLISFLFFTACSTSYPAKKPRRNLPPMPSNFPNIHQDDPRFNQDRQPPEKMQENACVLLKNYPHWRKVLFDARQKWNIQPEYVLAFIHQESRFNPRAMSVHKAYGYAQVKDESWDWYLLKTRTAPLNPSRERFDDAVDFISFYAHANLRRNGTPLNDVKNQYLAYHEGMGGFERGSYRAKPWLMEVSDKVVRWADMYRQQLNHCPI